MTRVDLTVMGGGIFGLAIAWEAARRGAKVRLIEAARIGAGSSGGMVGALSPHVPENWNEKKAFQLQSLLMAEAFWAETETVSGLPTGYGRVGRLQALPRDALDLARARSAAAEGLWQGRAQWDVVESTGDDWEPATESGFLVRDTLSARVHPQMALRALVGAIAAKGGEVIEGGGAAEGPVIWATGFAGLQALNADLGLNLGAGVKGQALSLRHAAQDKPQLFAGGLHIVPHADGTVAIGSTSESHWDDPTATDGALDTLLARAIAVLPVLADAPVISRWAGIRPRAKSRAPMLGAWPGKPGQFVANGGFKIGFGMAPLVAKVMVDLVLEGRDAIPVGFRL